MSEHTEQTAVPAGAVPARIELEDFIEAVTRGVARALAAQDEVSGYAMRQLGDQPIIDRPGTIGPWPGTITMGLIYTPPSGPFGGIETLGGTLTERQ